MPQTLRAPRTFNVRSSFFLAALLMGSALAQPITVFPHGENFDSFPAGTALANGWTQGAGDQMDWTADCCGTGSTGTGPVNDATTWPSGPGLYLYLETSSGSSGNEAFLLSPDFDITGVPNLSLEFAYHMFGATMGDLNVEIWNGMTYTTELTLSGAQQAAQGDPFMVSSAISLAAYTGVIHVRFRISRGTSFTGDGAIDDFRIFDATALDMQMVSIDTPISGTGLSATEPVTVTVTNRSALPAAAVPVSWELTGAAPQGPFMEVIPMVAAGATLQYVFTATADLTVGGFYDIIATVSQPGDVDPGNDVQMMPLTVTPFSVFPLCEDFDSFPLGIGVEANGWLQETSGADQMDWTAHSGTTTSEATGPSGDATSGTGNYYYLEASSGAAGNEAHLYSPDFDLSMFGGNAFYLKYHMYGATMGTLDVDAWNPVTMMYDNMFTISGQQQTSEADPWVETPAMVPVGITGISHVRLRATRGASFTGDICIDDFCVRDASAPSCAMVSLDTPASGCGLSAAEVVTVTVHNNSTTPAMSVPVSFEITGAFPQGPFVEMVPMIPAGSAVQYMFTATADCSMAGTYDFTLTVAQPGDIDPSDDTIMQSVFNACPVPALVLPISEDWEAGMGTWTLTGTSSWELGTPAGATIIGTPGGVGVNSWMTGLIASYAVSEDGAVESAAINLCGFTVPEVSLDIWWNSEFSWDGSVLQVSYDSGVTWENVGAFGDPNNWFNDDTINGNPGGQQEGWTGRTGTGSGGWVRASNTDLLPIPAQLRMAFGSDTSVVDDGVAFDNLLIREFGLQTTLDVGAFQPMQPVMASDNDTGVVVMAADITPDVGDDLLRGFDLIASGAGDDFTDILNVSVVLEDAATVNGVVDGMDTVIYSGTYPADDGTINVALSPGAGLIRMAGGTNSFLVVYDLSATASGAMPPTDYTVTLDNIQVAGDVMVPVAPPSGTVMVDACPTTLCGDCNLDGMISILDALNAAQHAAGLITLTGPAFSNCNVEGVTEPDPMATVTVLDALILAQSAAGLPVMLVCC